MASRFRPQQESGAGEAHIANALRLLLMQTIGGVAAGAAVAGVLVVTTRLGLSRALFVAAVVVAVGGLGWSLGGPRKGMPWTLGIARMGGAAGVSRRPLGTSQADAVLVISSILAGLLLIAAAVIVGG